MNVEMYEEHGVSVNLTACVRVSSDLSCQGINNGHHAAIEHSDSSFLQKYIKKHVHVT